MFKNAYCYILPTCGCLDPNRNQNPNLNLILIMSTVRYFYLYSNTPIIIQCMRIEDPSSVPSIFTCTISTLCVVFKLYKLGLMYAALRVQQWTYFFLLFFFFFVYYAFCHMLVTFCSVMSTWVYHLMLRSYRIKSRLPPDLHGCHSMRFETKWNLIRSEGILSPLDVCGVFFCLFVLFSCSFNLPLGCIKRFSPPQPG